MHDKSHTFGFKWIENLPLCFRLPPLMCRRSSQRSQRLLLVHLRVNLFIGGRVGLLGKDPPGEDLFISRACIGPPPFAWNLDENRRASDSADYGCISQGYSHLLKLSRAVSVSEKPAYDRTPDSPLGQVSALQGSRIRASRSPQFGFVPFAVIYFRTARGPRHYPQE